MTAWRDACGSFASGMTGCDISGGYDKETVGLVRSIMDIAGNKHDLIIF
tara:strand:- start:620 stop:766 length:147 start_codon:yes stop_codon:yes gene_type:complete